MTLKEAEKLEINQEVRLKSDGSVFIIHEIERWTQEPKMVFLKGIRHSKPYHCFHTHIRWSK